MTAELLFAPMTDTQSADSAGSSLQCNTAGRRTAPHLHDGYSQQRDWQHSAQRPGCSDFLALPSLINGERRFRA